MKFMLQFSSVYLPSVGRRGRSFGRGVFEEEVDVAFFAEDGILHGVLIIAE